MILCGKRNKKKLRKKLFNIRLQKLLNSMDGKKREDLNESVSTVRREYGLYLFQEKWKERMDENDKYQGR